MALALPPVAGPAGNATTQLLPSPTHTPRGHDALALESLQRMKSISLQVHRIYAQPADGPIRTARGSVRPRRFGHSGSQLLPPVDGPIDEQCVFQDGKQEMEDIFASCVTHISALNPRLLELLGPEDSEQVTQNCQHIMNYFSYKNSSDAKSFGLDERMAAAALDDEALNVMMAGHGRPWPEGDKINRLTEKTLEEHSDSEARPSTAGSAASGSHKSRRRSSSTTGTTGGSRRDAKRLLVPQRSSERNGKPSRRMSADTKRGEQATSELSANTPAGMRGILRKRNSRHGVNSLKREDTGRSLSKNSVKVVAEQLDNESNSSSRASNYKDSSCFASNTSVVSGRSNLSRKDSYDQFGRESVCSSSSLDTRGSAMSVGGETPRGASAGFDRCATPQMPKSVYTSPGRSRPAG